MLGAYIWETQAYEFSSMTPKQRIDAALRYGAMIHPQYPAEFDNGNRSGVASGAVHQRLLWPLDRLQRAPSTIPTCVRSMAGSSSQEKHASLVPAWQEGAVLSSLDAISRLHQPHHCRPNDDRVSTQRFSLSAYLGLSASRSISPPSQAATRTQSSPRAWPISTNRMEKVCTGGSAKTATWIRGKAPRAPVLNRR